MTHIYAWVACATLAVSGAANAQPASVDQTMPALVKNSCTNCHTFDKGGANGAGPNLYGIVGNKAASVAGFEYSPAFKAALGNKVWTPELLDVFFTDSEAMAPGSLMTFFLDDPLSRQKIIAYMVSLKP